MWSGFSRLFSPILSSSKEKDLLTLKKRLNTEVRCLVVFNGKIHVQARGASIGAIQIITSFIADFSMALTPFINAAYRIGPNKSQSFNKGQSCKSLDAN